MKKIFAMFIAMALMLSLTAHPVAHATEISKDKDIVRGVDLLETDNADVDTRAVKKAIIIVPGIGGTVLSYVNPNNSVKTTAWYVAGNLYLAACDEDGESVNNIVPNTEVIGSTYGILNTYQKLYESLNKNFGDEYEVIFFPYDWRMSCETNGYELQKFINNGGYSKVILVAHSMGGLVSCSYMGRSTQNANKVEKFISIGTPYLGSPKAAYVMETGRLLDGIPGFFTHSEIKKVVDNIPAVYELMPPNRSFTNYISVNGAVKTGYATTMSILKTMSWAKKSNGTIKPMFAAAEAFHSNLVSKGLTANGFSGVDTYKIYGYNQDTITLVKYDSAGEYLDVNATNNGDGTVTLSSAKNSAYSTNHIYGVEAEHLNLVKVQDTFDILTDIINGTAPNNILGEYTVNENGWLVGEGIDTKRISVSMPANQPVAIWTADGEQVIENDNTLSTTNADGTLCTVGHVYSMNKGGNPWKEYFLRDGDYEFVIDNAPTKEKALSSSSSAINIEYTDAGYYQKVIRYDDLPEKSIRLSVQNGSQLEVACIEEPEYAAVSVTTTSYEMNLIEPTIILLGEELSNYD